MLQLFQSIFGASPDAAAPYPPELIERAVDGTDPRLRALSGYRKKLRSAVIHAIDHVVTMVDGLPPALDLNPRSYGVDPEITAYFASKDEIGTSRGGTSHGHRAALLGTQWKLAASVSGTASFQR